MSKIKQLGFDGKVIYCGLDAHKTNWKINARMEGIEMASFSQNPEPLLLKNYFNKNYPGAELKVVYEAGFCGFEIQRSLTSLGVDCIVVNPADVPSSDKDRKRKDDKRDARKLSMELAKGNLRGIYIPDKQMQDARTLRLGACLTHQSKYPQRVVRETRTTAQDPQLPAGSRQ